MKIRRTKHFDRSYGKAPNEIQKAFDKQALLLLQNLRHFSLPAKKYDEGRLLGRPSHGMLISQWAYTGSFHQ